MICFNRCEEIWEMGEWNFYLPFSSDVTGISVVGVVVIVVVVCVLVGL